MTTINNRMGLKGVFNLKFTDVKTGQMRELEFTNLILDSGLDRLAGGNVISGCMLGISTNTPVTTDTQMDSILGGSSTLQARGVGTANTSTPPYWCSYYWTYRFNTGVATGNISQVAMVFGAFYPTLNPVIYDGLFSLALIKDSGGTPITITKLADEVLDVTYTLQLYCPTSDVTGTVSISGVNYNYIVRPSQAASWNASKNFNSIWSVSAFSGAIGTQLATPSGGGVANGTTHTFSQYTLGAFSRDLAIFWDSNNGNIAGGIRSITVATHDGGTRWQIEYSAVSGATTIPKNATKRLTLYVRFSWGRV